MTTITDRCYIDENNNWNDPNAYFDSDRVKRVASEREIIVYNALSVIEGIIWEISKKEYNK